MSWKASLFLLLLLSLSLLLLLSLLVLLLALEATLVLDHNHGLVTPALLCCMTLRCLPDMPCIIMC